MQQFKPYFTGELNAKKNFGSLNVVSVQKCFRTTDIDEVGDKTHLTFFEMLGNFSFGLPGQGGYFKREAILWAYEYVTQVLKISTERIMVTVFQGDKEVPKDEESFDIWHKEVGIPKERIKLSGRQDNFWGPTGDEGPCGPTTEIYVDGVEIWNLVFNQYYCKKDKTLEKLAMPGVDTGMGLERLLAVLQGADEVFETDLLRPLILKIYELAPALDKKVARILADHLRGSVFLIADGVRPSNKEVGYILRRLLRRILGYQATYDIHQNLFAAAVGIIKEKYVKIYPEVAQAEEILKVLEEERSKFGVAIVDGIKELNKRYPGPQMSGGRGQPYKHFIVGQEIGGDVFDLYQTYGLPLELIKELLEKKFYEFEEKAFRNRIEEEFKKHQEVSRAGAEKKFGGHGLLFSTGELKAKDETELKKVTRLHTATHLLQAALRKVLGLEVSQKGSDITAERTRFDFSFSRKLLPEEIKKVENLVNEAIQKDLPVGFIEMEKKEAEKTGALYFFREKYPERVKVYYAGHSLQDAFSKEFCGGPHVNHTLEVGSFKIIKEEAVGAGVRRIRGIVAP